MPAQTLDSHTVVITVDDGSGNPVEITPDVRTMNFDGEYLSMEFQDPTQLHCGDQLTVEVSIDENRVFDFEGMIHRDTISQEGEFTCQEISLVRTTPRPQVEITVGLSMEAFNIALDAARLNIGAAFLRSFEDAGQMMREFGRAIERIPSEVGEAAEEKAKGLLVDLFGEDIIDGEITIQSKRDSSKSYVVSSQSSLVEVWEGKYLLGRLCLDVKDVPRSDEFIGRVLYLMMDEKAFLREALPHQ